MASQRVLAIILMIGGSFWGLFCLPLLLGGSPEALILFGPGYVVTAGYILRACRNLSLNARVGVWLLSMLVQGAWFFWAMSAVFTGGGFEFVTLAWWSFAFFASVYAICTERNPGDLI